MDTPSASFWMPATLNHRWKIQPPLQNLYGGIAQFHTLAEPLSPIKRVLENHGINLAFKPYQTISKMFPKPEDQMDKEDTRDPVYDIPCANCSKSYVGETQRKFITRKSEHQKAVARRQGEKSALADHVIKTNHDIVWDEATILRTSNNWHQRKILEAWEISCAKDPLNRADGALLPKEYLHLTLANKKKWHISWN